ncbi:hypothetical protein L7F22_036104 [Adiantum nelumboides]|nr:hypothetical protein [Adiantum nelumboides]
MGPLPHFEAERISNSSLKPSSPLSSSALDEDRSFVGPAPRFFINADGYDEGGGNSTFVQIARNQGQNISKPNGESNARGTSGYGNHESQGWGISSNAPHEGLGHTDYEELNAQRNLVAPQILENRTMLPTTRSLDIGQGGLQYKRERSRLGYGVEDETALGYERERDEGIVGGVRRGYVHDKEEERDVMANKDKKERKSEKEYIGNDRYSDERREESGRVIEKGLMREDGCEDEGRGGRRRILGEQVESGERKEGGRDSSYLKGRKQDGKREEGVKGEEMVKTQREQGKGVVVVGEGGVDYVHRGQWLRAAILGANDGLVSTASLMMGVGAVKDDDAKAMIISGLAGLVGGACSMAIGEFISVYSQRDAERFDKKRKAIEEKEIHIEQYPSSQKDLEEGNFSLGMFLSNTSNKQEFKHDIALRDDPKRAVLHFFKLGVGCGALKHQDCEAMKQIGSKVGNHKEENAVVEEEISIGPSPWEAAGASGLAFALGAMVPLLSAGFIKKESSRVGVMMGVCSVALLGMGGIGAKLSTGSVFRGSIRVLLGGWSAMLVTYGLLRLFGASAM